MYLWDRIPNRDEVLDIVFKFLTELSKGRLYGENHLYQVYITDSNLFLTALENGLMAHLKMIIDDSDWDKYKHVNVLESVSYTSDLDEDLMLPIFSGKEYQLNENEEFSLKIFMLNEITPIRLHFRLTQKTENENEYFYLKLFRLTSD